MSTDYVPPIPLAGIGNATYEALERRRARLDADRLAGETLDPGQWLELRAIRAEVDARARP